MKRKRSYKRFKPVSHEIINGPKSDNLETHIELYVSSRGRIGGQTTYRKGSATLSLPRSDPIEIPHVSAPCSIDFDAFNDNAPASSNEAPPTKVRFFSCACNQELMMWIGRPTPCLATVLQRISLWTIKAQRVSTGWREDTLRELWNGCSVVSMPWMYRRGVAMCVVLDQRT